MTNATAVPFTRPDWDAYATCYDTLLTLTPYRHLLDEVVARLDPRASDTILDAGCGTGNLLAALANARRDVMLIGTDRSPSMLTRAARKCEGAPNVRVSYADLGVALPFCDESFDKVASVNVLYAVDNPPHVLAELRRVLRRDGTLVLATPKFGYDNGLILKAHAGSDKPDAYWERAHASPEREELLLREAVGDDALVEDMLLVARYNRDIARTTQFHFFTTAALVTLVESAGFTLHAVAETYAGQAHLITATKGGSQ